MQRRGKSLWKQRGPSRPRLSTWFCTNCASQLWSASLERAVTRITQSGDRPAPEQWPIPPKRGARRVLEPPTAVIIVYQKTSLKTRVGGGAISITYKLAYKYH